MNPTEMENLPIRRLDSSEPGFAEALRQVLAFEAGEDEAIDRAAAQILADVKARGDAAVLEATRRFDRIEADSVAALELSPATL
jgi:histidinol dehydrogenase